jgi:hypothetical protein
LPLPRAASARAAGLLLLGLPTGGCAPPSRLETELRCAPPSPAAGEVRVRRLLCSDDRLSAGDGRVGDWIVENSVLKAVFRATANSLTQLGVAGGTLVDLSVNGGEDGVVELLPDLGGGWMTEAELQPWAEGSAAGVELVGVGADGGPRSLRWILEADAEHLRLDPPSPLRMVPPIDALLLGQTLEVRSELSGAALLWAGDAPILADRGGQIDVGEASLVTAADRATVARVLGWTALIDVDSDGEWVYGLDAEGRALARAPVSAEGNALAPAPDGVLNLRATRSGHQSSALWPNEPGLTLRVGDAGILSFEPRDSRGSPIPAVIHYEKIDPEGVLSAGRWFVLTGGSEAALGPGEVWGWMDAGPAYVPQPFGPLQLQGDGQRISARFAPVPAPADAPPAAYADLDLRAWPDPSTRRSGASLLADAAAQGLRYAVVVAQDEIPVAAADSYTKGHLKVRTGSVVGRGDAGAPWSMPWTGSNKDAAHGVVDGEGLSAVDLVAAISVDGARLTMVDSAWVAAAPEPLLWAPAPDALQIQDLDGLPTYARLLDLGADLALVGPRVWLLGVPPDQLSANAAERALLQGQTVASNGPLLLLRLGRGGPAGELGLRVQLVCPPTTPIDRVALVGSEGEIAVWQVNPDNPELDAWAPIPAGRWVLATASGEAARPPLQASPPWAATSALWLPGP